MPSILNVIVVWIGKPGKRICSYYYCHFYTKPRLSLWSGSQCYTLHIISPTPTVMQYISSRTHRPSIGDSNKLLFPLGSMDEKTHNSGQFSSTKQWFSRRTKAFSACFLCFGRLPCFFSREGIQYYLCIQKESYSNDSHTFPCARSSDDATCLLRKGIWITTNTIITLGDGLILVYFTVQCIGQLLSCPFTPLH